jgi:dipeptidase E
MTRKLFLTSAGLPLEISPIFLKLLGKDPKKLKVAFIPTAADPEDDKWFVDTAKDELRDLGFKFEAVDLKQDSKWVKSKLEQSDIIYINGGNTFYLLHWIRKSGLDKYLGKVLDRGKIYVGNSAGSIIVGPNIESASWGEIKDENVVNLEDLTGLKIVPFVVFPHFTEKDRKVLKFHQKDINYSLIALSDNQAVKVIKDKYQIVGKGEEVIINSKS